MAEIFIEHLSYLCTKYSVSLQTILITLPTILISVILSSCEGGVYNQSVTEEIFSIDYDSILVYSTPALS